VGGLGVVDRPGSWPRRPAWPGRIDSRRALVRYGAPAAFLLAVTGVALAIRANLRGDSHPAQPTPVVTVDASSAATPAKRAARPKQWYVIQSGDTLGAIAARYGTTVDSLLRLNPAVQPTALTPGEHIRIH
jgi:nucleoid-associated protein YgaU